MGGGGGGNGRTDFPARYYRVPRHKYGCVRLRPCTVAVRDARVQKCRLLLNSNILFVSERDVIIFPSQYSRFIITQAALSTSQNHLSMVVVCCLIVHDARVAFVKYPLPHADNHQSRTEVQSGRFTVEHIKRVLFGDGSLSARSLFRRDFPSIKGLPMGKRNVKFLRTRRSVRNK